MITQAARFQDHLRILMQRCDEALAATQYDGIAVYAGALHWQFLDDQPYPFKINPHFKWWVPLQDAAESWLQYRPGRKPILVFHQPHDYWHQPPATPRGDWLDAFDVRIVREPAHAQQQLDTRGVAFIGEVHERFRGWGFAALNPEDLLNRLHYTRAIKTEYELDCMRRASLLGARGHRAAESAFRAGASEYEIHLEYLRATGHAEAELPYPNIIALNENAAVLHYQHQSRVQPDTRLSLLIDAGAQHVGYASDITRTYAARDDEFAALISAMDQVQRKLCDEVREGVDYAAIHLHAHREIAQVLQAADLIDMAADDAVASGLTSVFFPHGIGHLLGLQVHDVAGFSITPGGKQKDKPQGHPYLRLTRTLQPGFVVTIEPGIYFIEMLLKEARASAHARHIRWDRVAHFAPYGGIRIEDNVVCTPGAPENLTRPAFEQAGTAS